MDEPTGYVDERAETGRRGYKWPAFEKGNTVSLRHGARTPRMVEPIARQLADQLADVAPWTCRPAFAAEVEAWSWAEAQCRLLRAWIDGCGLLDDKGEKALGELHRAETRAASARQRLGLSPLDLARLLATFAGAQKAGIEDQAATELDALRAEGRKILEARAADELPASNDDGGEA